MVLRGYGDIPLHYINPTNTKPTATVIFLHGLGSNGKDTKEKFLEALGIDAVNSHIKIIFPTAPTAYIEYLNKVTTIWHNVSRSKEVNFDDARTSINYVYNIYNNEVNNGTDPQRIVIGGFSQGACIALGLAYTKATDTRGAAVIAGAYDNAYEEVVKNPLPDLYQIHGSMDKLVPLDIAKKGFGYLKMKGVKGKFCVHDGKAHILDCNQIIEIYDFIKTILPPLKN